MAKENVATLLMHLGLCLVHMFVSHNFGIESPGCLG